MPSLAPLDLHINWIKWFNRMLKTPFFFKKKYLINTDISINMAPLFSEGAKISVQLCKVLFSTGDQGIDI